MLPQGLVIRCRTWRSLVRRVSRASGGRGQQEGQELVTSSKADSWRGFAIKRN